MRFKSGLSILGTFLPECFKVCLVHLTKISGHLVFKKAPALPVQMYVNMFCSRHPP